MHPKKQTDKPPYAVFISYSEEDEGYVARVPALKYCTAFGETREAATREIEVAIEGWLETAEENNIPIPPAGPTTEELFEASPVLNLKEIARRAGIPGQTLYTKVRRKSELRPEESDAVANALSDSGLVFFPSGSIQTSSWQTIASDMALNSPVGRVGVEAKKLRDSKFRALAKKKQVAAGALPGTRSLATETALRIASRVAPGRNPSKIAHASH
jgi:predicted RNase H-like HicB family nuclease